MDNPSNPSTPSNPYTISSLDSSVINSEVSRMSDTELCGVLSLIDKSTEVDIMIKCDDDSLDKIRRVTRENSEALLTDDGVESGRVIDCIAEFESKDNPSIEDYMKVADEMALVIDQLKEDSKRCEDDITRLEIILRQCEENFSMYREDLDEESVEICEEKITHTTGLIRLRRKTLESNKETISALGSIVTCMMERKDGEERMMEMGGRERLGEENRRENRKRENRREENRKRENRSEENRSEENRSEENRSEEKRE
jgi:hypothetical protein